jgi:hypothetical protein
VLSSNGTIFYEADDGGIYQLLNRTNAVTREWVSLNGNLSLSEISSLGYDALNDILFAGAQDVGNQVQVASDSGIWKTVSQGDGNAQGVGIVKNAAGEPIFVLRYIVGNHLGTLRLLVFDLNNNLLRETTQPLRATGTNQADFSAVLATERAGFTALPMAINAVDPSRILLGGNERLYESLDRGVTATNVKPASVEAAPSAVAYGGWKSDGTAVQQVAYAAFGSQIWWRGVTGNFVAAVTQPAGATKITKIVMDPTNWEVAYAVDDAHIYATIDGGKNWRDITPAATGNASLPVNGLQSLELVKALEKTGGLTDSSIGDIRIDLRDGSSFQVNLASATTYLGLKTAIENASKIGPADPVRVSVSVVSGAIKLTASGTTLARVVSINGSLAARDLKLLADQATTTGSTITGGVISTGAIGDATLLSSLNVMAGKTVGVRVGQTLTDVLLVGTIDGLYRSLNPLGNPADSDGDYRRLAVASGEVTLAGANNDLIFTAHGSGTSPTGAAIAYDVYYVVDTVAKGADGGSVEHAGDRADQSGVSYRCEHHGIGHHPGAQPLSRAPQAFQCRAEAVRLRNRQ